MIIEHRLEDVLWRNVDRIILMKDGGILADLHPDELLSTGLLGENGIREPLYLTAMRYAGVDILPEKKPSHVDSVIINESDRTKIHNWFHAQPTAEKEAEKTPLLEVKNLSFGYTKDHQTLRNVSLSIGKGEMVSIVGKTVPENPHFPSLCAALKRRIPVRFFLTAEIFFRKIFVTEQSISGMLCRTPTR